MDLKRCDPNLAREIFSEFVDYNAENGKMFWKVRDKKWFHKEGVWKRWNSRYSKNEVGSVNHYGYRVFAVFNRLYHVSRVAWLLSTGAWPEQEIDHIDGNKTNNRLSNLREATRQENGRNKHYAYGEVPLKGVSKYKHKYRAHLGVDKKQVHLGYFDDAESAHAAYRKAAEERYGEFWNPGDRGL